MTDLSILIPARNEMFLSRTIQDILEHAHGDTEIIAVLDGCWPPVPIPQNERVTVLYYPESIGQRAATNRAAAIARGKYVMKCDAHCAFDDGFDVKMLALMEPDITMVPVMRNLHAFDWVCKHCGMRVYQGPQPTACRNETCTFLDQQFEMDIVWIAKTNPQSAAFRFTPELEFKYFPEYKHRQHGDLVETMSLQGSCFLVERERYHQLNLCDETWGSWGGQGAEVAIKSWLSGGRVMCNKRTWYAHLFRTQSGFSHPYPNPGNEQRRAKDKLRKTFLNSKWEHQARPLSWLVDKFSPVPDWEHYAPPIQKGIVYYTCNTHRPEIDIACRAQLDKARAGIDLTCVTLNKALGYGDREIVVEGERSPVMMHKQILAGLEASRAEYIFLCESDVLYHPSHFDFIPRRRDVFYYNTNVWRMRLSDGLAVWTDDLQQVSGLCASRELLLDYYTKRLAQIERDGFNRHYEPGIKQTIYPRMKGGKYGVENRRSEYPNICIRHEANLTRSKWAPEEYRNPQYAAGWRESEEIPGWGRGADISANVRGE